MQRVGRVRFSGRAARFLQLLQEFGHLDEARLDELYAAVAERMGRPDKEVVVDLPMARRFAASFLFGRSAEVDLAELDGVLAEDWPLLFS